jgi:hypothetical protein
MPKIVVTIDKFGQPNIDAQGYTGTACKKATAEIEKALSAGARTTETRKPEMFVVDTGRVLSNRGG